MKDNTSPISQTERSSISQETKTEKDKMFISGRDMVVQIRDGELSILINQPRKRLREFSETSDSMSADHSTSDLDFQ
jgi:hypothetical protein